MFAQGVKFDILDQDHLLGVTVEDTAFDDLVDVLMVALGQKPPGLRNPFRRLSQTLAIGIFTDFGQKLFEKFFQSVHLVTRFSLLCCLI